MYQVSTLQALALGYTRAVMPVSELLDHGRIGLGTFQDVDGEMIVVDGGCYRATDDGSVVKAAGTMGVPFASVSNDPSDVDFDLGRISGIKTLQQQLTLKIEEGFGLNSMHVAKIDGKFDKICARSEVPYKSHHVDLKDILSMTQTSFEFDDIEGTLVCVYYPDFMDGINLPGWHVHFISADRTLGGHVFDIEMESGTASITKESRIEIQLPTDPAFDTYALKQANEGDIKKVEQK